MRATKEWGPCSCDCGKTIVAGAQIEMLDGAMYLAGHQNNRRTRQMAAIVVDEGKRAKSKG